MGFLIDFANTFNFRRFQEKSGRLTEYCPWSLFVGDFKDGIALLKAGALMRCYSFTCPDLGSASAESIGAMSYYFNEAVKSLGGGWAVQFEAQRALSNEYPGAVWTNPVGFLIDRRRQEIFSSQEAHFVCRYFLTFTHNLQSGAYAKAKGLLYKKSAREAEGHIDLDACRKEIRQFAADTDACVSRLKDHIAIEPMDRDECLTYIHSSVSSRFHRLTAPVRPMFLDHFITDVDLDIGSTLKLGAFYIPIVAIKDFPLETYPAIFNAFNGAGIEYRWSTRWIGMDKLAAVKEIERYQKRYYGSRKSMGQMIFESATSIESGREDPSAMAFESDTDTGKSRTCQ